MTDDRRVPQWAAWLLLLAVSVGLSLFTFWYFSSRISAAEKAKDPDLVKLANAYDSLRAQFAATGQPSPPAAAAIVTVPGDRGPQGPQGVQGLQGVSGLSPPCLFTPTQCVGADSTVPGPSGTNGQDGRDSITPGPQGPPGEPLPSYTVTHPDGSVETCNLRADQSGYDCTETTPPSTTSTTTTTLLPVP